MASSYTTLLGLVLPVTGELTNTWGGVVNAQLTQLIDDAIAGSTSRAFTSGNGDWTLTTTGGGAQNEARLAILIATGTPGGTRYIYAPQKSKMYVVVNNFTDQSTIYIRGGSSGSATTGVKIEAAGSALVTWDTTVANSLGGFGDFVKVAGGGGGAAGTGSNQIFFQNDLAVTGSYTIPTGKNAGTFGPVTINLGVTVTVPSGSVWTVV